MLVSCLFSVGSNCKGDIKTEEMYSNGDVLVNMCCYGEGRHSAVYGARIPVTAYVSVGSGVFPAILPVTKRPGGNGVTSKYGCV